MCESGAEEMLRYFLKECRGLGGTVVSGTPGDP